MSKRKRESFNEVIVGVFMTVVILLLAYFTIVISGVDILKGNAKVTARILFDQVGGLKDHDSVMYRGTKVGKVETVEVTPSNLVVTATINRNVILRDGYRIAVCNLSMLGGNYLLLEEGQGQPVEIEGMVFRGETPSDWMRDISEITENVRAFTEMREVGTIVTNIVHVSAKADAFMARANALAADIDGVVAEARQFIARATSAAERIDKAAERADHLVVNLDRDTMFDDLAAGVTAFRKAAESLDLTETRERANRLLANLNEITDRLQRGEGTLGKLATDADMYDELNKLIKDSRQILDNFRDTTPITTFSSLATGAL